MIKKKKKVIQYKDLELDSNDELQICHYLEELRKAGYINHWLRGTKIQLTEGLDHLYVEEKVLKTKTVYVPKIQKLILPSIYTCDFEIWWNKKAEGIFVQELLSGGKIECPFICDDAYVSIVESKPSKTVDPHNMLRVFRMNQKFMWKIHSIFVNLVVPEDLFRATFTPKDVKIVIERKTKKPKWERVNLNEYVRGI